MIFSLDSWFNTVLPLLLFMVGIAVYATFIFRFYRFVASRDLFRLDLHTVKTRSSVFFKVFFYVLKYLVIFPLFVFFWFGVMALLLIFLSKNYSVDQVLLISIAIVGAIRMTAYYDEDLSKDLAKMIPFTMLAIFLIDGAYFSWDRSVENLFAMIGSLNELAYFLFSVILLEFVLRMLSALFRMIKNKQGGREKPV